MNLFSRFVAAWLFMSSAACNGSAPTLPASPSLPGSGPSVPGPASYVVSGILSENINGILRPLVNRRVNLYISGTCAPSANPGSDCRPEKQEVVSTDQNGRYKAEVPKTRVYVASNGPELQPCLASALVEQDTTIDLQVTSRAPSPLPSSADAPMITGVVYETTPQGRKPLPGITAWLEVGFEGYLVAITETDTAGRFFFCSVNAPVRMGVSRYQDWFQSIPGTGDMFFEIELKR